MYYKLKEAGIKMWNGVENCGKKASFPRKNSVEKGKITDK